MPTRQFTLKSIAACARSTSTRERIGGKFPCTHSGRTSHAQGNPLAENNTDQGNRSTVYDALGLPQKITDALGQATSITRDLLGRPTLITYADSKTTTLRYDLPGADYNATPNASIGYLSEIVDRNNETTRYQRDSLGRVVGRLEILGGLDSRFVPFTYVAPNTTGTNIGTGPGAGEIATLYNAGNALGYSYDSTGRLSAMRWNWKPLISNITWNPLGQPLSWTWDFADDLASTSVPASRTYDTAGRLTKTEFSSYSYDPAGRITSLTQNLWKPADTVATNQTIALATTTWGVTYDNLGRITGFGLTGYTTGFGYDNNGNRLSSVQTQPAMVGTVVTSQITTKTYTIPGTTNRLSGYSQSIKTGTAAAVTSSTAYSYNANGDLLSDGQYAYNYDASGRLSSATKLIGAGTVASPAVQTTASPTTRYAYNAWGRRSFKTEPLYPDATTTTAGDLAYFASQTWNPWWATAEKLGYAYTYDEAGTLISEIGKGGAQSAASYHYIYLPTANGPMPIAAAINGSDPAHLYAVHSDHLNTPRRLTRSDGKAVWQWAYSAFGDEQPTIAAKRFTSPSTNPTAGTTSTEAITFNLRYPGQVADVETGLNYNYFRTYDAKTGRYTQSDPIGMDGGWNRFGYVEGNPMRFADPLGQFAMVLPFVPAIITGIDLAIGAGLGLLSYEIERAYSASNTSASDEKSNDHADYHKICDQPPPPNLDKCEFMKWKISQLKQCIAARQAWDSKWNGDHSGQINQKAAELKKWEKRLDNAWDCKKDCP